MKLSAELLTCPDSRAVGATAREIPMRPAVMSVDYTSIADVARLGYVGRKPGAGQARPAPTVTDLPPRWQAGLQHVGLPVVFAKQAPAYDCVLVVTNATETQWYHALLKRGLLHALPTGRIKGSTRGCTLFLCSANADAIERFAEAFDAYRVMTLDDLVSTDDCDEVEE
jgi:hypothetical protein